MAQTGTADDVTTAGKAASAFRIHEDWLAVVLGAIALLLALTGLVPALPALRWGGAISVLTLASPDVLIGWVGAGVGVGILAAAALALEGGDVARFARGFPIVFALAWLIFGGVLLSSPVL